MSELDNLVPGLSRLQHPHFQAWLLVGGHQSWVGVLAPQTVQLGKLAGRPGRAVAIRNYFCNLRIILEFFLDNTLPGAPDNLIQIAPGRSHEISKQSQVDNSSVVSDAQSKGGGPGMYPSIAG